ncbi:MAG: PIN domain-containing protein [Spirochaetales bacterium]|nr:PIN domain-containing protein [Spirochaetales bacterium]
MDSILVDTSAWIEFFRKREPYYSNILKLIDDDRICCTGIILAELIQGAKTLKEVETLKDFIHVFSFFSESEVLWEKAGKYLFA